MSETVSRYVRFYVVTSPWFDLFRAVGNVVLFLALGRPLLGTLERYRDHFTWQRWAPNPWRTCHKLPFPIATNDAETTLRCLDGTRWHRRGPGYRGYVRTLRTPVLYEI